MLTFPKSAKIFLINVQQISLRVIMSFTKQLLTYAVFQIGKLKPTENTAKITQVERI